MTLSQLQYFCALAEKRNFTKAAQACYTSQPNLSRQIAAMEEELGFRLFIRDKRNVTLTVEGKQYYQCCSEMLALHEQALDHIRADSFKAPLKVGSMNGFHVLSEALRKIIETGKYPNISVTNGGLNQFNNGEIDFCFTLEERQYEPSFLPIYRKTPVFLIPNTCLKNNKEISMDLVSEIGISMPMEGFDTLAGILRKNGFKGEIDCFQYSAFDYDSYLMHLLLKKKAGYLVNDVLGNLEKDFTTATFPDAGFYVPVGALWNPEKDLICRSIAEDLKKLLTSNTF